MSISAAIDGLGVCLDGRLLAKRELQTGRLVLPFGNEGPEIQCHSVRYFSSRARLPKLQAFRDWLFDALREEYAGPARATTD